MLSVSKDRFDRLKLQALRGASDQHLPFHDLAFITEILIVAFFHLTAGLGHAESAVALCKKKSVPFKHEGMNDLIIKRRFFTHESDNYE